MSVVTEAFISTILQHVYDNSTWISVEYFMN